MLKDMMTGFQLLEPTTVDGALELMAQHGDQGWVLATCQTRTLSRVAHARTCPLDSGWAWLPAWA